MTFQDNKDITIRGGMFGATLATTIAALLYGLTGPMVPLIMLKMVMLIGAVFIPTFLFSYIKSPLAARVVVGIVAGVCAVVALWFGWYWSQFGLDSAMSIAQAGPSDIYKRMYSLSFQYVYAVGDAGSEVGTGRWMTLAIWGGETVLVLFAPIFGAFQNRQAAHQSTI